MAKGKCRDCSVCTRSTTTGCLHSCFHLFTLGIPITYVKIMNMGRSKCPTCGHPLKDHYRRKDGSFED